MDKPQKLVVAEVRNGPHPTPTPTLGGLGLPRVLLDEYASIFGSSLMNQSISPVGRNQIKKAWRDNHY